MSHKDMPSGLRSWRPATPGPSICAIPFSSTPHSATGGMAPRSMAQPPLHPAEPVRLHRLDSDYSPVEIAIRQALEPTPTGPEVGPVAKMPINR
jgi:hypothetical protein